MRLKSTSQRSAVTQRIGRSCRRGFTLVELAIVMLIIGLLISFILVAANSGVERARVRATQALIMKLEVAVNDRLQALQGVRATVNNAHRYFAATPTGNVAQPFLFSEQRAQVLAQVELLKMEMPDVFFIQAVPGGNGNIYVFNFTGQPFVYPGGTQITPPAAAMTPYLPYILPLGNCYIDDQKLNAPNPPTSFGAYDPSNVSVNYKVAGTGIFGASYAAAAGLLKNLGNVPTSILPPAVAAAGGPFPLLPAGYDMVDNDADGLVDELEEGLRTDGNAGNQLACINLSLANHRHNTARSEMLYAILVEGRGPLGSVFNRDDFTGAEVQDTDSDGLPEFVDAWGQPLQFFRWPTHYNSEVQHGAYNPQGYDSADSDGNGAIDDRRLEFSWYRSPATTREQCPLDPNGLLISPSWWANITGPDPRLPSLAAQFFMTNYFCTIDPLAYPGSTGVEPYVWDRNGYFKRRAFNFKFLILSGGEDQAPGVPLLSIAGVQTNPNSTAQMLIMMENTAPPFAIEPAWSGLGVACPYLFPSAMTNDPPPSAAFAATGNTPDLIIAGKNDISNHNMNTPGGGTSQ